MATSLLSLRGNALVDDNAGEVMVEGRNVADSGRGRGGWGRWQGCGCGGRGKGSHPKLTSSTSYEGTDELLRIEQGVTHAILDQLVSVHGVQ